LDDAACALIHCSLQLSDANPEKAKYVEQEKRGATYYNEQRILEETGLFKYKMPWQLVADLAISRPNDAIYQYAKPAADKVLGAVVDTGFMYVDSISRFQKNLGDTLYAMAVGPYAAKNQIGPFDLPWDSDGFGGPTAGGSMVVGSSPIVCSVMRGCIRSFPIVVGSPEYIPSNVIFSGERKDSAPTNNDEKPSRYTNDKHHPNSVSPEPKNVDKLYENSIVDGNGVRWAQDSDGTIHRFSKPSNGQTHWNG